MGFCSPRWSKSHNPLWNSVVVNSRNFIIPILSLTILLSSRGSLTFLSCHLCQCYQNGYFSNWMPAILDNPFLDAVLIVFARPGSHGQVHIAMFAELGPQCQVHNVRFTISGLPMIMSSWVKCQIRFLWENSCNLSFLGKNLSNAENRQNFWFRGKNGRLKLRKILSKWWE